MSNMEQRGTFHYLLAIVLMGATSAVAYSMGRQAGAEEGREAGERAMLERRMAQVLDHVPNLYSTDRGFEAAEDDEVVHGEAFATQTEAEEATASSQGISPGPQH